MSVSGEILLSVDSYGMGPAATPMTGSALSLEWPDHVSLRRRSESHHGQTASSGAGRTSRQRDSMGPGVGEASQSCEHTCHDRCLPPGTHQASRPLHVICSSTNGHEPSAHRVVMKARRRVLVDTERMVVSTERGSMVQKAGLLCGVRPCSTNWLGGW